MICGGQKKLVLRRIQTLANHYRTTSTTKKGLFLENIY